MSLLMSDLSISQDPPVIGQRGGCCDANGPNIDRMDGGEDMKGI